jgi:hypothetical protein
MADTASEMADRLNAKCPKCDGGGCKICEGSGRLVPPSKTKQELSSWFSSVMAANMNDIEKARASIRRRTATVIDGRRSSTG